MQQIYSILLVISGERYDAQDALGMLYTCRISDGRESASSHCARERISVPVLVLTTNIEYTYMKKTLIALMAAASCAMADTPITLGSWFTNKDGSMVYTVDAVQTLSKANAKALGLSAADGLSYGVFSFNLNVDEMMFSTTLTENDVIQVTEITLASNSQHASESAGQLSITFGGNTYVSEMGVEAKGDGYGTLTYTFTGENVFSFSISDNLSATIDETTKVCIGVFQGQSGVGGVTEPTGYTVWQPAVKITGVVVTDAIPEPATATLSLLALAGLAARRRRH